MCVKKCEFLDIYLDVRLNPRPKNLQFSYLRPAEFCSVEAAMLDLHICPLAHTPMTSFLLGFNNKSRRPCVLFHA